MRSGKIPGVLALLLFASVTGGAHLARAATDTAIDARSCPYRPTHAASLAMSSDDYPLLSVAQNEQGVVVLDFLIQPDGSIADVRVAKSSGFARLDGAAVDAASQRWHFDPVLVNEKPVSCRSKVSVAWMLQRTPEQLAQVGFAVEHLGASDYPPGSLARHEQGTTLIMAVVDPTGKVLTTTASQSSGFADLDSAAIGYVRNGKWPIVPARVSGKPVSGSIGIVVVWSPTGR
jgi:TonB family protein